MNVSAVMDLAMPIKYNGEVQSFTDVNGKAVYPLVYEGTTYLPVRAVCSLAGIPVQWNQETGSVLLGEGDKRDVDENIYRDTILVGATAKWTKDPSQLVVGNQGHPSGVALVQEGTGALYTSHSFGYLQLDKKYNILHFVVESDYSGTLYLTSGTWYGSTISDATILKSVDLQPGVPVEVNLSVANQRNVYIGWGKNPDSGIDLRIVDMWLK